MFVRLKTGCVRAKISLTGQLDGGPAAKLFQALQCRNRSTSSIKQSKLPVLRNMTAIKKR